MLAPSVVIAELRGPIYVMDRDGRTLLVPATQAVADFVVGLLGTSSLMGLVLGWLIGRNRRAAGTMALAAFALALGPGHNIPLLGGTGAVAKELLVLAAVTAVASLVLVEGEAWRAQRVTDTRQQQFRCRSKGLDEWLAAVKRHARRKGTSAARLLGRALRDRSTYSLRSLPLVGRSRARPRWSAFGRAP